MDKLWVEVRAEHRQIDPPLAPEPNQTVLGVEHARGDPAIDRAAADDTIVREFIEGREMIDLFEADDAAWRRQSPCGAKSPLRERPLEQPALRGPTSPAFW